MLMSIGLSAKESKVDESKKGLGLGITIDPEGWKADVALLSPAAPRFIVCSGLALKCLTCCDRGDG